jgi:hypothetical protein
LVLDAENECKKLTLRRHFYPNVKIPAAASLEKGQQFLQRIFVTLHQGLEHPPSMGDIYQPVEWQEISPKPASGSPERCRPAAQHDLYRHRAPRPQEPEYLPY